MNHYMSDELRWVADYALGAALLMEELIRGRPLGDSKDILRRDLARTVEILDKGGRDDMNLVTFWELRRDFPEYNVQHTYELKPLVEKDIDNVKNIDVFGVGDFRRAREWLLKLHDYVLNSNHEDFLKRYFAP